MKLPIRRKSHRRCRRFVLFIWHVVSTFVPLLPIYLTLLRFHSYVRGFCSMLPASGSWEHPVVLVIPNESRAWITVHRGFATLTRTPALSVENIRYEDPFTRPLLEKETLSSWTRWTLSNRRRLEHRLRITDTDVHVRARTPRWAGERTWNKTTGKRKRNDAPPRGWQFRKGACSRCCLMSAGNSGVLERVNVVNMGCARRRGTDRHLQSVIHARMQTPHRIHGSH